MPSEKPANRAKRIGSAPKNERIIIPRRLVLINRLNIEGKPIKRLEDSVIRVIKSAMPII